MANPDGWAGYGADVWGLSASDGPADVTVPVNGKQRRFFTYSARGADFTEVRDDGTLAPTAAAGSLPSRRRSRGPRSPRCATGTATGSSASTASSTPSTRPGNGPTPRR